MSAGLPRASATCPQAVHTSYYDRDIAEAVARARGRCGIVCRVTTCDRCGNYRLVRVA